MLKYPLFTALILFLNLEIRAQNYLNVKFFGLNFHPKGDLNATLMPLNPDKQGYLVLSLGGTVSFEHFLKQNHFSVKAIQAVYADCASQLSGFTHLGLRWVVFRKGKHSLNGGIGPTFIYRRNWHRLEGYQDSGYFNGQPGENWQHKFIGYAGELEYNFVLSEQYEMSTTFVPGYPDLMSLSFGLRYQLNKKVIKENKSVPEPGQAVKR